jgi:hypothetical protein
MDRGGPCLELDTAPAIATTTTMTTKPTFFCVLIPGLAPHPGQAEPAYVSWQPLHSVMAGSYRYRQTGDRRVGHRGEVDRTRHFRVPVRADIC